jgi:hypothetical protein
VVERRVHERPAGSGAGGVLAPGFLAHLGMRSLGQVRLLREDAAQQETDLSYLRKLLQARIDIVRAEQRRRSGGDDRALLCQLPDILARGVLGGAPEGVRHSHPEPSSAQTHRHLEALLSDANLSDVGALPADDLETALRAYLREEAEVSRQRSAVQRVVAALNDEIARRYRHGRADIEALLAEQRHGSPEEAFGQLCRSTAASRPQNSRSDS